MIGGFAENLVDHGPGVAVETTPQLPPRLVEGRLHDEESVVCASCLGVGRDPSLLRGFPSKSCDIGPLHQADCCVGDPREGLHSVVCGVAGREVIDEVGKDVVRFIMLTRKNDAPLEFDLARVLEQSRDNPVFYVQYAHARVRSVLRHAAEAFPEIDQEPASLARGPLHLLTDSGELDLMKRLALWPRLLEGAADAYEPHRVAFYLYDLAAAFHGLWTKGRDQTRLRFLVEGDPRLTAARLALVQGIALVIASGLNVFGVKPVEEMR